MTSFVKQILFLSIFISANAIASDVVMATSEDLKEFDLLISRDRPQLPNSDQAPENAAQLPAKKQNNILPFPNNGGQPPPPDKRRNFELNTELNTELSSELNKDGAKGYPPPPKKGDSSFRPNDGRERRPPPGGGAPPNNGGPPPPP